MPLAYRAPTTLPALVPATMSGARPLASSILITPMCAKPFAAPPPSAMPMRTGASAVGIDVVLALAALVLVRGTVLPQAAKLSKKTHATGRSKAFKRMPSISGAKQRSSIELPESACTVRACCMQM